MAQKIAKICDAENVSFIFKASYDKANRTSVKSYRGIGVRDGCALLASGQPFCWGSGTTFAQSVDSFAFNIDPGVGIVPFEARRTSTIDGVGISSTARLSTSNRSPATGW